MGQKAKNIGMGLYRAGLLAGVGALLWMQSNFVTRERFEDHLKTEERMDREVILSLKTRLDRIENKLDRL